MIKECEGAKISDYSFLILLLLTILSKRQSPIVRRVELERELYPFYSQDEYSFLFEDICPHTDPTGENSYVDLSRAFQQAYFSRLLLQLDDKSIINCTLDKATEILSQYTEAQREAMSSMLDKIKDPNQQILNKKPKFGQLS